MRAPKQSWTPGLLTSLGRAPQEQYGYTLCGQSESEPGCAAGCILSYVPPEVLNSRRTLQVATSTLCLLSQGCLSNLSGPLKAFLIDVHWHCGTVPENDWSLLVRRFKGNIGRIAVFFPASSKPNKPTTTQQRNNTFRAAHCSEWDGK